MKGGDLIIPKGTYISYKCLIHMFIDKSDFEVVKTLGKTVTNTPLRWTIPLIPTGLRPFQWLDHSKARKGYFYHCILWLRAEFTDL